MLAVMQMKFNTKADHTESLGVATGLAGHDYEAALYC